MRFSQRFKANLRDQTFQPNQTRPNFQREGIEFTAYGVVQNLYLPAHAPSISQI